MLSDQVSCLNLISTQLFLYLQCEIEYIIIIEHGMQWLRCELTD